MGGRPDVDRGPGKDLPQLPAQWWGAVAISTTWPSQTAIAVTLTRRRK
jgi:hypothetical protein